MSEYTRLRPHWRPTHGADPHGFDRWIAPDGTHGWVKILNPDGHHCANVWKVAPQAMICLRLHGLSEDKEFMKRDPVGCARSHVEQWANFVANQGLSSRLQQLCFEGINEPSWEPPELPPVITYNVEFIEGMSAKNMTPTGLQMNTGWPTNHGIPDGPPDWTPFEPVRLALIKFGGYLSVHEYWDIRGPASSDWLWNPGRIFQIPDSWATIPVLITEVGYDIAVNAPHGTPNHGYRGHQSDDAYMAQLTEYDRRMRYALVDYPTKPKIEALFVFSHDFDKPWGTFDTLPILDKLCGHAEWVRGQPDITPPLPPDVIYEEGSGYVTAIVLNIRSGPGTNYPVIGSFNRGEHIFWDATSQEWLKLEGENSWVSGNYVSRSPLPSPPDPDPEPENKWLASMNFVFKWEGGYQNYSWDIGNWTGCKEGVGDLKGTNFGISACSYPTLDIKNLTKPQATQIYEEDYWIPSGASKLDWPYCLLVFDTAVLFGVGTAQVWLSECGPDPYEFCARRLHSHTSSQNWVHAGKAWTNRVAELLQEMG